MKTILFINGCIREKNSRTLRIAKTYLYSLNKAHDYIIIEKNLSNEDIQFASSDSFDPQTGLQKPSSTALSEEFASADQIVLAAPFWEFMFPAIINCYFEKISVAGITFKYTDSGSIGLCKATSFIYIYTSGDYLKDDDKLSETYLKKLTQLYGIDKFSSILVDGLDIQTNDPEKLVNNMCKKIKSNTHEV